MQSQTAFQTETRPAVRAEVWCYFIMLLLGSFEISPVVEMLVTIVTGDVVQSFVSLLMLVQMPSATEASSTESRLVAILFLCQSSQRFLTTCRHFRHLTTVLPLLRHRLWSAQI